MCVCPYRKLSALLACANHNVSGFALYRALLRRGRKVIPIELAKSFEKHTRDVFRTNSKAHSHAAIRAALSTGYRTLEDLASREPNVLRQLGELSDPSTIDRLLEKNKQKAPAGTNQAENHPPRHRPSDTGRRWPKLQAIPVLDGLPLPPPGKLRRVPTLVNANHIPFLRFKKPQSPFLSYMIRKKNGERQKRLDRIHTLEDMLLFAEDEDQWDKILRETNRIFSGDEGLRWTSAISEALTNVKKVHQTNIVKRMRIAQRMFNILQEQKNLAEQERSERRDRRHQAYKARRREREAAIAAERSPVHEEDRPADSAATT
ncbi:MAG: hypothetical protein Q9225_003616 [Loekoesia sp. 1 TL-2023]